MIEYTSPEFEFVEFEKEDTIITSTPCPEFVCESDYGTICDGRPYNGN